MIEIASLFPERLNIHGDAENAEVLCTRARWRGCAASVVTVSGQADAEGLAPDAITIGSGFDADGLDVLDSLRSIEEHLRGWLDSGAVLLAVGLGWDLLSTSVELHAGSPVRGLGIFSGRAISAARRVGRIVLESEWGNLTGYEYHLRDYQFGTGERALGRVLSGTGNVGSEGSGAPEGVVRANAFGTGVRGPVLARNPVFADHLLGLAAACADMTIPSGAPDPALIRADAHAEGANRIVRTALGVAS